MLRFSNMNLGRIWGYGYNNSMFGSISQMPQIRSGYRTRMANNNYGTRTTDLSSCKNNQ